MLHCVLLASWVHLMVIPAFGALSDVLGRRPVYLGGAVACALLAFPFFWLIDTRTTGFVWLAIALGLVAHAAMYGPQASFFSELFGTRVRYSGASLGYQLASVFAGGLSPLTRHRAARGVRGPGRVHLHGGAGLHHRRLRVPLRRDVPGEPLPAGLPRLLGRSRGGRREARGGLSFDTARDASGPRQGNGRAQ